MKKIKFAACQKVIFTTLLIIAAHSSFGQILNVEKSRIKEDSSNYFTGNLGFSFSLFNRDAGEDQPNNFLGLSANADLAYFSELHSYQTINILNYTAAQDKAVIRTGYSHFRINLMRLQRLSYELFTQYQYDLGRGLETRWLGGGGLRLNIVKKENFSLTSGTGIMYEIEEWESPGEDDRIIESNLLKSTNYISTRVKVNEHVDFNTITYYQTGHDDEISAFRHRISADANINVKLTDKLALRTTFNCTYENRPIVPITKFIYAITNGIQVNF